MIKYSNYFKEVTESALDYLSENQALLEGWKIDGLEGIRADIWEAVRYLEDELVNEDAITGNASGSFYCNAWKAQQAVLQNMDIVRDAIEGLGYDYADAGEMFLCGKWEKMDVIARCYVLPHSICAALEEIIAAYDGESENETAQAIASRL